MAADEAEIVAERQQLVDDRLDQRVVIAAGNIAASDRTVEHTSPTCAKRHLLVGEHHAARRMAGQCRMSKTQFADRNLIASLSPRSVREIAHASHAELRAAVHYIVEQEFVRDMRPSICTLRVSRNSAAPPT